MEFPITFDTVKSGWSIEYIEGVTCYNFQNCFSLSQMDFVFANRADPDVMPSYAAFHMGHHCLT